MDTRYWPFPNLKPESEWTDFDRDYVKFMQQAYAEGFRPREAPCVTIEAESPAGRFITLALRGSKTGWEPIMSDAKQAIRLGPFYGLKDYSCICIRPPFQAAAHFALEWLRGRDLASILDDYVFTAPRHGFSSIERINS